MCVALTIVNLVGTSDLGQRVNLVRFAELEHVLFDHEVYGGRLAYLKASGMIASTRQGTSYGGGSRTREGRR